MNPSGGPKSATIEGGSKMSAFTFIEPRLLPIRDNHKDIEREFAV